MEFQVLGPLQVIRDGQPVYFANAPKPRLLLAILLANAGRALSVDRLIGALWGGTPPSSARQNLHQYVHRLRLALGQSLVQNVSSGYLMPADVNVDSRRFLELAQRGTDAFERGQFETAAETLSAGLDLWRGDAFEGVADAELITPTAVTLEQTSIDAAERWAEAMLACGQARAVLPRLAKFVERFPLNEGLRAHMMRALADSGRQSEALQLYRDTRAMLVDQLGVEPGAPLQQVHETILRNEPAPPSLKVPRELPANVSRFVGRTDALAELDLMLPSNANVVSGPVVISAIAGTAGVGKTALAVKWAHQAAREFPDGQLYINLNGYSSGNPVAPLGALSTLLSSLGMHSREIPSDLPAAAARYRTLLSGRRVLIILDNARSADQVRPLLPGSPGCFVLITSRDRLNGLVASEGARRLNLDTLNPAEAAALLEGLLGAQRLDAERGAVEDLAKLCAYLPLALRIAAARLADQPRLGIRDYVNALEEQNPAEALATDEGAVRTAFQHSYKTLNPLAQRVFRRLGLLPLQDFSPASVAQLANISVRSATQVLEQLASAHLVGSEQLGRYRMHDLLTHYASLVSAKEPAPERDAAISRLYCWYLASIHAAASQFSPHLVRLPLPEKCDDSSAYVEESRSVVDWINCERQNLALLALSAARTGPRQMAWRIADGLRGFYEQMPHTTDRIDTARAAVAAARREQDSAGMAAALQALAHACYGIGRYRSCESYLAMAARFSAAAGWAQGQASILANLSMMYSITGRAAEGIALAEDAIRAYQAIGDLSGEAKSSDLLANCYRDVGRLEEAIERARSALNLYTSLGSRPGQAQAGAGLGQLDYFVGDTANAIRRMKQALHIHLELAAPLRVASVRVTLAFALLQYGSVAEARDAAEAAGQAAVELNDIRLQVRALIAQGAVEQASGNHRRALDLLQLALSKGRSIHADHHLTDVHLHVSAVHISCGEYVLALEHATTALTACRATGSKVQEGQALNLFAEIALRRADRAAALEGARQALDLHKQTGHRPGEIKSRELLDEIAGASGSS